MAAAPTLIEDYSEAQSVAAELYKIRAARRLSELAKALEAGLDQRDWHLEPGKYCLDHFSSGSARSLMPAWIVSIWPSMKLERPVQ